ncbi:hypothetical protein CBFG_01230 [Clostridiales bacterium 1_7_47FAA]|nr:hypothetical protein CBFG_01230 [Clostridiales bacterium 1_7_47FAA]
MRQGLQNRKSCFAGLVFYFTDMAGKAAGPASREAGRSHPVIPHHPIKHQGMNIWIQVLDI